MNTAIYLELMIEWHKDVLNTCCNEYDRMWKRGQIALLQSMVDEIDAISHGGQTRGKTGVAVNTKASDGIQIKNMS